MEKKTFGLEEYQQIHDLVYEYQAGSQEAAEKLINNFKVFLKKYISLIKYGQYALDHYSIRSFIKLFIEDQGDRAKINCYFAKNVGRNIADKAVAKIVNIFSNSEDEDIEQELYTIFLNMCSKYKDDKPSFHHHVKRNFHYYAYRHFEKLSKDPIARGYVTTMTTAQFCDQTSSSFKINNNNEFAFDYFIGDTSVEIEMDQLLDEIEMHYNLTHSNVTAVKQKGISVYDDEFLNTNWINGVTCSDVFKELTPFERKILIMWYIDNKTDSDIAEEFGVCRGTINKRRAIAKAKLEEAVIKNKNIKNDN